jgi:hypothetical protein
MVSQEGEWQQIVGRAGGRSPDARESLDECEDPETPSSFRELQLEIL